MIRRNSRSCRFATHLFITGVLLMYAQGAAAVTLSEVQKLVGSDSVDGDHFSRSMDIDGDTIVVSATNADTDAPVVIERTGAVYVFERNTGGALCPISGTSDPWCQQAKVTAADAEFGFEAFGEAVAIEGDTLFVGARRDDAVGDDPLVRLQAGSVYVFTRAGGVWTQQAKLIASDATDDVQSRFGAVLAVDGDVLAVTATRHPDGGTVYVFRNNAGEWIEEAKLSPPPGNSFGAVTISGNMLAIGSSDDDVAIDSGAVFVYEFDGSSWNLLQKVKADDAAENDIFGTSVEMSGNQMIVGAPHIFEPRVYSGAAYIFELIAGSWVQQARLTADDSFVGDAFGFGIGIIGTTAVVTADLDGGPIILQAAVAVRPDDDESSLAARVLTLEHQLLPRTVRLIADGRVQVEEGRVRIAAGDSWRDEVPMMDEALYPAAF